MKSICHLGPLHGTAFSYSGKNSRISCGGGHYVRTTNTDTSGLVIWQWAF